MKKPLLFILTLALSLAGNILFSAKTQALSTDEKTWYTIAELVEYQKELEAEGVGIQNGFIHREDDKSRALANYMGMPLSITSFNPSTGTITVHYQGNFLNENLKNLHIARFNAGDPDYAFNETARYSLPLKPSTRLAVSEREEINGEGWLPPNQEITFQMIDANFEDDIDPVFWFFFDTNSNSWGGQYHFRDCLESPDYREGMDCRLVFTKERPLYIPAEPEPEPISSEPIITKPIAPVVPEPVVYESTMPEPAVTKPIAPEPIVTIAPLISQSTSQPAPNPIAPLVATTQATQTISQTPNQIEIPNLGETCHKERAVIFPWWLIILMLIGDAAVLWLFWPKNSKKYKKSLDKKGKVR